MSSVEKAVWSENLEQSDVFSSVCCAVLCSRALFCQFDLLPDIMFHLIDPPVRRIVYTLSYTFSTLRLFKPVFCFILATHYHILFLIVDVIFHWHDQLSYDPNKSLTILNLLSFINHWRFLSQLHSHSVFMKCDLIILIISLLRFIAEVNQTLLN